MTVGILSLRPLRTSVKSEGIEPKLAKATKGMNALLNPLRGSFCSEPLALVDQRHWRLTIRKTPDVFEKRFQMPLGNAGRCGGDVRRQNRVFHSPQAMVWR